MDANDPQENPPEAGLSARAQKKAFLKELFSKRSIHPLRKLGQNFLLDPNLLDFIVETARISAEDTVLEVGVGTGQLTSRLVKKARAVVGVEVDRNLFDVASGVLGEASNLSLLCADALASRNQLNPQVVEAVVARLGDGRLHLVSNLAYRIATPLILDLLESSLPFFSMTVTIQMELAERITARQPGDHGYGPVSILVQSWGEARIVRPVHRDVFWPRPRIRSAIVRIDLDRQVPPDPRTYGRFKALVKGLFTLRRKTLQRSLEALGFVSRGQGVPVLEGAGIRPDLRPENLRREDFLALMSQLPPRPSRP